jgi:hypothetical protein
VWDTIISTQPHAKVKQTIAATLQQHIAPAYETVEPGAHLLGMPVHLLGMPVHLLGMPVHLLGMLSKLQFRISIIVTIG